jgi:predicted MPP superfamily phosphohydrolase
MWSPNSTINRADDLLEREYLGGLNRGETTPEEHGITIPNDATPGNTYYIGIIADYDYDEDESDEANNDDSTPVAVTINSPPSSLSGTVTNSRTTFGISGALVSISGPASKSTTTGDNGNYSFTDIPAGTYTLSVSEAGYRPYSDSVAVSGNTTKNVSLTPYVTISTLGVLPTEIFPGGRLRVTYYLSNSSSSPQTVWLGASVKRSGTTNWLDDPTNDIPVNVPGGASNYQAQRYFDTKQEYSAGYYDIRVSIWQSKQGGIMVERYDLKEQNNAFIITPAADLALLSMAVSRPADAAARTFAACGFDIKNNGPTALSSEYINVDYYLSNDTTFGDADDVKIGDTGFTVSISSGETYHIDLSAYGLTQMVRFWTENLVGPANYYVFARVTITDPPPTDLISGNDYDRTNSTFNYNPTTPPRGSVQFKSSTYSVEENGPSVRIYVSRTGGSYGSASVSYATADGTATAGSDYTAKSGILNWSNGDAADNYFDVPILNDSDYEGNETFTPSLSGATGASLGSPSATTITITDDDPPEPEWSFVHITDLHIGFIEQLPPSKDTSKRLCSVIDEINRMTTKPDFLLVTGDVVDHVWQEARFEGIRLHIWSKGHYKDYREIMNSLDDDIDHYEVPGNHDRYVYGLDVPWWVALNPNIWIMAAFADYILDEETPWYFYSRNLSEYRKSVRDSLDYDFDHKGFTFVGLDSASDIDEGPLYPPLVPEGTHSGTGLLNDQMQFLEGLGTNPKVIFMHHPAVHTTTDDWVISENRGSFIEFSRDLTNNVQIVLCGHTHENHVFDRNQDPVEEEDIAPGSYPLFLQTAAVGVTYFESEPEPPTYRVINVRDGRCQPQLPAIVPDRDAIATSLECNSSSHIYDSLGRHVGMTATGAPERTIPHSFYLSRYVDPNSGVELLPERMIVFDPCDDFIYEVVGEETESYRLEITSTKDGNEIVFEANGIPSLPGAVHDYVVDWDALSQDPNDQNAITIDVDADGDGAFEKTIISDINLTGDEFVSEWPLLNDYVTIQLGEAGYDHQKKRLGVNVTVTNTSGETLGVPVWVVIEGVSEPNVALADANGVTSQDKNYADFSDLLLANRELGPGKSITKRIYFNNPDGVRFTFEPSLRGVIVKEPAPGPMEQLSGLATHWLASASSLDVAPAGGDGIINFRDFAVMADDWLNRE